MPKVSLTSDWTNTWDDTEGEEKAEGSKLAYDIKACWQVIPSVALEGGYRADTYKYTWEGAEREWTWDYRGFFLGARASF